MSVGTYGISRPSDVNISDIDIFYTYAPNRETKATTVLKLAQDSNEVLSQLLLPADQQNAGEENLLEGMYNLSLPGNIFNAVGIYTLYLKPKVYRINIADCGVLLSLPTINGILINSANLPSVLTSNNALQGYRIEYINLDGTKLRNLVRYIVTSNKAEPVVQNIGNTSQKVTQYRFNDNGNLLFLQVTPSSSTDVKPNVTPFIGNPNQVILISNTFFKPLMIEIEMVNNTIDTLTNYIAGNQIKNVNTGIITHYDENNNIAQQEKVFILEDDITNIPLYEVKQKNTQIDITQDFNTIVGNL